MVKHSRFSTFDSIKNNVSLTYKLVDPILNSNLSLGEFLGNKFKIGEYHKVDDLKIELFFFGVDVYPTFIAQGRHRSLYEIGILYTKYGSRMIDHPLAHTLPLGVFLMRDN